MTKCVYKSIQAFLSVFILINCANAQGSYENFKISELRFSRGADGVHIVYSGGTGNPNPDNCDRSDIFVAPYSSNTPEREKAMLTGVETAYVSGKTVSVFLSGCIGGIGGQSYPSIWYFYSK